MEEKTKSAGDTAAKSGKMGCGPLIIVGIILVILFGIGANEAIGFYFGECEGEDIFECLMSISEEEPEPEGAVSAKGTYSFKDYSVEVTANIPLEGGAVTGSITGTCDGKVKGKFDGKNNGVFNGTIVGTCDPFFVKVPASADFNGVVNKDSKSVPINFTGRGAGLTHKDSMTLSY